MIKKYYAGLKGSDLWTAILADETAERLEMVAIYPVSPFAADVRDYVVTFTTKKL